MPTTTTNKAKYVPKAHARFNRRDAKALGEIIYVRHKGNITAEQLVDEARAKASPIHHLFEWDDTKAAEEYRLEQARHHIRHIHVEFIRDKKRSSVRALHHVTVRRHKPLKTPRYVDFRNIRKDQSQTEQVIDRALRELRGWQQCYKQYKFIFREVFDVIDGLDTERLKKRSH